LGVLGIGQWNSWNRVHFARVAVERLHDRASGDNAAIVVRMTDNGFEPNAVTVPAGTAVRFSNEDGVAHWPASAPHPVHTDYPEFDAKRGIAPGESYSFVFDKVGTWKFHDHLNCCSNPKWFGTVAVQ